MLTRKMPAFLLIILIVLSLVSATPFHAQAYTTADLAQANAKISSLQAAYQKSSNAQERNNLAAQIQYATCQRDNIKKAMVGLPQAQCPVPAVISTGSTTISPQLTFNANANRTSGTTNDTFAFSVATNIAASRVVLVAGSNTYQMTSADNRNFGLSLKGNALGTGNMTISIRAYPPNSMVAVTKNFNVTIIPASTTAQQLTFNVNANRTSGTTNDTFAFSVATNIAASRVVLVAGSSTYQMTSADNRNWGLSLKGNVLGAGNITISMRAYPQNSMVAVTKTFNVTVTQPPPTGKIIGDDYPYKNAPVKQHPECKYGPYEAWGFCKRSCTSFVAWRLNNINRITFTNGMRGGLHGNAKNWGSNAKKIGFTVNTTPEVGSVAWFATGVYGHVAWVAKVDGDNITIEEYNHTSPDHCYGTRIIKKNTPTGYIHYK